MSLAQKLAAPQLKDLQAYQSARRIGGAGQVYLNANESPYPAYQMPEGESWQRYPDFLPAQLAQRYAEYAGVAPAQVLATRGADEGIDLMVRAFCAPVHDAIMLCPPTYAMYEFIAQAHQVRIIQVALKEAFELDLDGLCAPGLETKLIFLCHPNNPSGNLLQGEDIRRLLAHYRDSALVVVDEAYIEFCPGDSCAGLLNEFPNLVILRTLSKAFSLAAVRVGFLLAAADVIELVSKLIAPYPMPDPSARIALAALGPEGLAHMTATRDRLLATKDQYQPLLAELPCVKAVYPSVANFLLLKLRDSEQVFNHLRNHGVILRDQSRQPGLANHLRVSIGTDAEMAQLLDLLSQLGDGS